MRHTDKWRLVGMVAQYETDHAMSQFWNLEMSPRLLLPRCLFFTRWRWDWISFTSACALVGPRWFKQQMILAVLQPSSRVACCFQAKLYCWRRQVCVIDTPVDRTCYFVGLILQGSVLALVEEPAARRVILPLLFISRAVMCHFCHKLVFLGCEHGFRPCPIVLGCSPDDVSLSRVPGSSLGLGL